MSANSKLAIGVLLWMQACFLGSTFGTWIAVVAVSLVASAAVISDHQKEAAGVPVRQVANGLLRSPGLRQLLVITALFAILILCMLWRLGSQPDFDVNVLSVGVDAIAHWGLFSSLLLWGLLPRRCHFVMLGLGLIVLLAGVASGGISRSISAQTSIALLACMGFLTASQIILRTRRGSDRRLPDQGGRSEDRTRWMRPTVSLTTLSFILMTTGVVANSTNRLLPGLQLAVQEQLHDSLDVVADRTGLGGSRYVKSGKIGSIRNHMTSNPQEVALVVQSNFAPGYMRGRVYDIYQQQRWFTSTRLHASLNGMEHSDDRILKPTAVGSTKIHQSRSRRLNRFVLSETLETLPEPAAVTSLTVYNNPTKGYVIFSPLATIWIEASSDELSVDGHGAIGLGIDVTQPYVTGVGLQPIGQSLSIDQTKVLTEVPESLQNDAARIAAKLCNGAATTPNKAAAVSRYFQRNGKYSLDPPQPPPGVDPIAHFLRNRHPAHCEYYATATVAILRSAGISSRYVTGYIVSELDETTDNTWLARNQHAHAWVEAYDEEAQRWFAVESTPGRTYQTVTDSSDSLISNHFAGASDADEDDSSYTLLEDLWGSIVSIRATDAVVIVFQFAQLPVFLFLVGFWWIKFRRNGSSTNDLTDVRSLRMLRKVDRLTNKLALRRRASETLFQFADRIEAERCESIDQRQRAQRTRLAQWYRSYATARYRGNMPQPLNRI